MTRRTVGAGAAWYAATRLDPAAHRRWSTRSAPQPVSRPRCAPSGDVEVVRRSDERGRWAFLVNHGDRTPPCTSTGTTSSPTPPSPVAWTLPAGRVAVVREA